MTKRNTNQLENWRDAGIRGKWIVGKTNRRRSSLLRRHNVIEFVEKEIPAHIITSGPEKRPAAKA
jgi:hypothetical protein